MCAVSMVGDLYKEKWQRDLPNITRIITTPEVSRREFNALKKEVKEMKELLKKAKEYDAKTGQPDCEMEDKVEILKKIAEMVGVDLNDVL